MNASDASRLRRRHLAALGIVGLLLASRLHGDEQSAEQTIAAAAAATAKAIAERHEELAKDSRKLHALIDELLRPQFDFEGACRLILQQHWTQATREQRKRFVAAFYRFLIASHGRALLEFRYDTITVLPSEAPPDETTRVHTLMKLTDGSQYHVDYYMRHGAAGWRILDVIAEGVSYVRTYRTDFGAEIRATSLDSLIDRLEQTKEQTSTGSR